MNIQIKDGLPTVEIKIKYKDKEKILKNVLLDTGSSNIIFDVDSVEDIGLVIDPVEGKARRMYGVGGESELCYEQKVENLDVGNYLLNELNYIYIKESQYSNNMSDNRGLADIGKK